MRESKLWEEKKLGSKEAREKLLELYLPLVRAISKNIKKRLSISSPNLSELESAGVIGLVQAVDNFDPDRGLKFITYALPRIRGAIFDELRNLDFLPRSARERVNLIQKNQEELTQTLSRTPSQDELAQKTNIPPDGMYLYNRTRNTHVSLDTPITNEDESVTLSEVITQENFQKDLIKILAEKEMHHNMFKVLNLLSSREKLVIALHYLEGFRFNEIGRMLGITESRVSQIHSKGLKEMKSLIERAV